MNKKILILLTLTIVIVPAIFVNIASSQQTIEIDNFSLSRGWNLAYGLTDPSQIIGQGSNSNGVTDEEIRNAIEFIYVYAPVAKNYVLLYAKEGTKQTEEYKNFNPPEETPTSVTWVYSQKTYSIKYKSPEYPLLSNRDIIKGWNFITISPEMENKSINDIKGNCTLESVYTYGEEDGVTQWLNLQSVIDDKRMLGEGSASGLQLVIKVGDDCRMGIQ